MRTLLPAACARGLPPGLAPDALLSGSRPRDPQAARGVKPRASPFAKERERPLGRGAAAAALQLPGVSAPGPRTYSPGGWLSLGRASGHPLEPNSGVTRTAEEGRWGQGLSSFSGPSRPPPPRPARLSQDPAFLAPSASAGCGRGVFFVDVLFCLFALWGPSRVFVALHLEVGAHLAPHPRQPAFPCMPTPLGPRQATHFHANSPAPGKEGSWGAGGSLAG